MDISKRFVTQIKNIRVFLSIKILGYSNFKFLINFLTNIGLMIIGVLITISILSYNKFDPSLNTSSDDLSNNLISYPGSYAADLLIQAFGFASILISIGLIIYGFFSLTKRSQKPFKVIVLLFICVITLSFSGHIISENGGVFGLSLIHI